MVLHQAKQSIMHMIVMMLYCFHYTQCVILWVYCCWYRVSSMRLSWLSLVREIPLPRVMLGMTRFSLAFIITVTIISIIRGAWCTTLSMQGLSIPLTSSIPSFMVAVTMRVPMRMARVIITSFRVMIRLIIRLVVSIISWITSSRGTYSFQ